MADQEYSDKGSAHSDENIDEGGGEISSAAISIEGNEAFEDVDIVYSKIRQAQEDIGQEASSEKIPHRTVGVSSAGLEKRMTCAFYEEVVRHSSHSCPQVIDEDER